MIELVNSNHWPPRKVAPSRAVAISQTRKRAEIALLDTRQRQHHRHRAHQEHEGADRGVRNVEQLVRERTLACPDR